jgi:hypothetical protein
MQREEVHIRAWRKTSVEAIALHDASSVNIDLCVEEKLLISIR